MNKPNLIYTSIKFKNLFLLFLIANKMKDCDQIKEYPYPPIEERVNGKDVSIIGVRHTYDFFLKSMNLFLKMLYLSTMQ
jgi:hypothetical protein